MDGPRFDELTKALTTAVPRRRVLRGLVGSLVGALVEALSDRPASAAPRRYGARCGFDAQCATGFCYASNNGNPRCLCPNIRQRPCGGPAGRCCGEGEWCGGGACAPVDAFACPAGAGLCGAGPAAACGPTGGSCFCFVTTEGFSRCADVAAQRCPRRSECATSADCPPDHVCAANEGCCGLEPGGAPINDCLPRCRAATATRSRDTGSGYGR